MTTEDKMTIDEQLKYLRRMKKRYARAEPKVADGRPRDRMFPCSLQVALGGKRKTG